MSANEAALEAFEDILCKTSEEGDTKGDKFCGTNDDKGGLCGHVLFVGGIQVQSQKL